MTPPQTDHSRQFLELLNVLMTGQKTHTTLSRSTNDIAHRLKNLMSLIEPENQNGPGGETTQGLVQMLIDQIASLEEAQGRMATAMLAEMQEQTRLIMMIAKQLGVRVPPRLDSA